MRPPRCRLSATISRRGRNLSKPEPALKAALLAMAGYSAVRGATSTYLAVWGISEVGASNQAVGVMLLVSALAAPAFAFAGGQASDRLGRRRPLVLALLLQGLALVLMTVSRSAPGLALTVGALVVLIGAFGAAHLPALVADMTQGPQLETWLGRLRVYQNVGYALGPPAAGILLTAGWRTLFVTLATISLVVGLLVRVTLPLGPTTNSAQPAEEGQGRNGRVRLATTVLLFSAAVCAMMTYASQDSLLSIFVVDSLRQPAATWGLLAWINPVLVTLLQVPITKATSGLGRSARLTVATLLLGLPFALLLAADSLLAVVTVLVLATLGEILWAPAAQAAVLDLAPPGRRGAYLGLFGAALPIGAGLGPAFALYLRGNRGDSAMWLAVVGFALVGAAAYALMPRARMGTSGPVTTARA